MRRRWRHRILTLAYRLMRVVSLNLLQKELRFLNRYLLIRKLDWHKQVHVQSLVSYASRNSESRKSEMAAVLDMQPPSSSRAPRQPLPPVHVAPSDGEFAVEDAFIATCDMDKLCSPAPLLARGAQDKRVQAMKAFNMSGAHFGDNCQTHLHL